MKTAPYNPNPYNGPKVDPYNLDEVNLQEDQVTITIGRTMIRRLIDGLRQQYRNGEKHGPSHSLANRLSLALRLLSDESVDLSQYKTLADLMIDRDGQEISGEDHA